MKSRVSFIFVLFAMLGILSASATPVTMTFTGLKDSEAINNYYNGGLGGSGSTGGPNYGVSFTSDSLAVIGKPYGGSGNVDKIPAPGTTTAAFFLSGAGDTMNVAAGFDTGFAFYYASPFYVGSVNVYSGLNGTGSLLATDVLSLTGAMCNSQYNYSCWVNSGVSFTGVARSAVFTGTANYIAFADITLGSPTVPMTVTPEPSSFLLLGTGLLGMAEVLLRRARLG